MLAVGVVAIGAGAFVTTTVAATFIIRSRISPPVDEEWVQVDLVEKGLSDGPDVDEEVVYEPKHGNGWKEYTADEQEKFVFEPGLLAPLVIHDELAAHSVDSLPETHTPLSPEHIFPSPPKWQLPPHIPDAPEHILSPQRSPTLEPAALLTDGPEAVMTHVPKGSEAPMTYIAEDSLDSVPEVLPGGIISWPTISSTPDEEPISPSDTLTPVPRAASGLQLELIPPTPLALEPLSLPSLISPLSIKTPVVQDDRVRPMIDIKSPKDPTDPFRSPGAHSHLDEDLLPPPPVYTRYDTAKSPIDPALVEAIISPLVQTFAAVNLFIDEAARAARVPLPLSIPPTPKPRLLESQFVDEIHLTDDQKGIHTLSDSDRIQSPITPDSATASDSTLSDIDSDISFSSHELCDLSALNTPTEPKGLAPAVESKPSLGEGDKMSTLPIDSDDDIRIGEIMEVPDDIHEQPTPDPPEATLAHVPLLPGSFDYSLAVSRSSETAVSVSLLTGDVVQLCKAILAVSNCAGLVAQFVVGLSVWWSLMLVPV